MTLRSKWPGHCAAQINIEFSDQRIILFSEKYFLDYHMPYPFDKSKGNAKFVTDKYQLELCLPRDFSN